MSRVYLDWNATAPLRPEAREAMVAAMDIVGNPSSVHAEGRAAKMLVEKAREQVAALVGCRSSEVVFTSGATEAAATPFVSIAVGYAVFSSIEHDCVQAQNFSRSILKVDRNGRFDMGDYLAAEVVPALSGSDRISVQTSNSETGVLQDVNAIFKELEEPLKLAKKSGIASGVKFLTDIVQSVGKVPINYRDLGANFALVSAHKIGGPKGVGALISADQGIEDYPLVRGGGQEMGRRAGTENVIGIAGFGAAAEAAQRDLENGVWDNVEKLRDQLEDRLLAEAPDLIIFGKEVPRLPNTSNFAIPGWKGETQVMQMDLAGFAVSAGSACSSGKVKASRVLQAMGFDENTASSAIRVSIGPTTSEAELMAFADTWIEHYQRFKKRAA